MKIEDLKLIEIYVNATSLIPVMIRGEALFRIEGALQIDASELDHAKMIAQTMANRWNKALRVVLTINKKEGKFLLHHMDNDSECPIGLVGEDEFTININLEVIRPK